MSATGTNTSTHVISQLKGVCWLSCRSTCSRRCRTSPMSWTLVSYTRCWMTDHSARHVATELTRPQSGGLCHLQYGLSFSLSLFDAAGNILRVHYNGMKCDVSFSQGSVSTLFKWGGYFCNICVNISSCLQRCKNYKNLSIFSRVMITNVLPHFYGSHCIQRITIMDAPLSGSRDLRFKILNIFCCNKTANVNVTRT